MRSYIILNNRGDPEETWGKKVPNSWIVLKRPRYSFVCRRRITPTTQGERAQIHGELKSSRAQVYRQLFTTTAVDSQGGMAPVPRSIAFVYFELF